MNAIYVLSLRHLTIQTSSTPKAIWLQLEMIPAYRWDQPNWRYPKLEVQDSQGKKKELHTVARDAPEFLEDVDSIACFLAALDTSLIRWFFKCRVGLRPIIRSRKPTAARASRRDVWCWPASKRALMHRLGFTFQDSKGFCRLGESIGDENGTSLNLSVSILL